jgi:hypothetical protein
VQVDVSQTGFVTAGLLAMFRKLGQPIKTVVSPSVHDTVSSGTLSPTPLPWHVPQKGRVGNGQAVFYTLDLTCDHLASGFIIFASCPSARVKILLWDKQGTEPWNLCAQEDSVKFGDVNVAALFNTGGDTLDGVPRSMAVRPAPIHFSICPFWPTPALWESLRLLFAGRCCLGKLRHPRVHFSAHNRQCHWWRASKREHGVQEHLQHAALKEKKGDPSYDIFRALDAAKPRDRLLLKAGQHLVAGVCDCFH